MKQIFKLSIITLALLCSTAPMADAKVKNKRTSGKRTVTTQSIKKAYIKKVNSLIAYGDEGYFLTDITGDGVPELWVKYGTCEADYMLDVYTYSKSGLKRILRTGASHTGYYGEPNGDYVIAQNAHMGYEVHTRITYTGKKLREKVIYESPGEVENYKDLSEPYFEFISFKNSSAINNAF